MGFGEQTVTIASGKESTWMLVGASPRKAATVVYLMDGYEHRSALLDRLGPHTIGRSCSYLKRLDDVDVEVLRELITASVQDTRTP